MFDKFKNNAKFERQLTRQGGVVAWATITDVKKEWATSVGTLDRVDDATDHLKISVRVEPDGGEPFDATFHQGFSLLQPSRGWQCKVIFDPKDPSRIAVLEDSITPPGADRARADSAAQIRGEAMAAAASGNIAEFVETLQARAMRGELGGTPVMSPAGLGGMPGVDPKLLAQAMAQAQAWSQRAPASTPSVADQLAKLAELRDRGVITDEEFAAQKAKLLAQG